MTARWVRLLDGYDGPRLPARALHPDRPGAPGLDLVALLDTGATHSVVDLDRVVAGLGLAQRDVQRLRVAGARAEVPTYEVMLSLPDLPFPTRRLRVAGMQLPEPFAMLLGMDLMRGTRLALEWRDDGRWLRWEPLD
ncbi:MAG TPA: retropepsin-like aspartic protease [Myxococcota bacterium]|nr:retropepsin-like aspartic protease [Myxococcota bacterium]